MRTRVVISILLSVLFFVTVSVEWHVLLIMLMVIVWRKSVRNFISIRWKWGYATLWGMLWIALVLSLPRYFPLPTDRVRHYYVSENGTVTMPPVHHWLLNAILPEEELCNIGMKMSRLAGPMVGIGQGLMGNLRTERERGTLSRMMKPYDRLTFSLENPMSAAYVQGVNQFTGESGRSFYLLRPKHYSAGKSYPLVVFCHGYLGNWKLYTGVLRDLENCIVLSVGTRDLSGLFSDTDLRDVNDLYIPLIENMGYRIQHDNLSIMGLSNGGSAVNRAYRSFSGLFRNIVFISTTLHQTHPIESKILIIGGGEDPSAASMRQGYDAIRRRGGDVARYWDENGTHFIFAVDQDSVTSFLNRELGFNISPTACLHQKNISQ